MEKEIVEYLDYIKTHRENIKKAFDQYCKRINKDSLNLDEKTLSIIRKNIEKHDMSKYTDEEFLPYLKHFFGKNDEKSEILFKKAVESHKKTNLHHPEAWIDKRGRVHDMPYVYIVEMICDWWSFSIAKGEMTEIID